MDGDVPGRPAEDQFHPEVVLSIRDLVGDDLVGPGPQRLGGDLRSVPRSQDDDGHDGREGVLLQLPAEPQDRLGIAGSVQDDTRRKGSIQEFPDGLQRRQLQTLPLPGIREAPDAVRRGPRPGTSPSRSR